MTTWRTDFTPIVLDLFDFVEANIVEARRRLVMTRGCRNVVMQQVGSDLGYSGRGANPFGKAARDPIRKLEPISWGTEAQRDGH
jgi:hypothetical protein